MILRRKDIEALNSPLSAGRGDEDEKRDDFVAKDAANVERSTLASRLLWLLTKSGVEKRGVQPVPLEERTNPRYLNVFTIWFCINCSLLPITFGLLGPGVYLLSLRDSSLVILFFCLLTALAPAYIAILGPKTGMRQMIQARYSFGRYLVCIPVLLNMATLTGFCVIISVIGGTALSAVTDGRMTASVGIVIVALLALLISFCGFRTLHVYERYAWIPALIGIVIATGTGGHELHKQVQFPEPEASQILSFGMIVASYMIPYAAIASDFTTYLKPEVPAWKTFTLTYLGLLVPAVPLMVLGSAIAAALPNVPSWEAGYASSNTGGIIAAMLSSAGGFGKFVVVVLSFSLLGNLAATMYSITLNFQILVPYLVHVPRYLFAVVITAIVIPVSITAATNFFTNLENFIGLIGYWSAEYVAIAVVEHLVFRKGDYSSYDHNIWNTASLLPIGVAAIAAPVCAVGLIVPCMAQVWYTGPIAKHTGDIGFEVGFFLSAMLYVPFRAIEKKLMGR